MGFMNFLNTILHMSNIDLCEVE